MEIQVRTRDTLDDGGSAGGSGKKPPSNRVKIIAAVLLFIVAGLAAAWNFGVFEGKPDPSESSIFESPEEEEKAWEDAQRERDRVHPPDRTPPPSGS